MPEAFRAASGEGRRILIVDDDEAVLKALSDYFARLGYEVVRAGTGKQGIAGYSSQEPDVTILDLKLPDMDGLQVLDVLRRKKALVILLTGYGDIPTAVQAMQMGAENFLTKPVDLPHLVATVERAIEKLDLARENVRLRRLIPSTRKRVVQIAVTILLVLGSLVAGQWVGGIGIEEEAPPEIAPNQQRPPAPLPPTPSDTLPVPAQEAPAASTGRMP
ncbi:MAG: response regulator [Gemmatimonadetes bacterium]|nr:response regulator [Gemmatimonadota bacterium]